MGLKIEANTDVAMPHAPPGGGHYTFLLAAKEEFESRGKKVQILDPLRDGSWFTRFLWQRLKKGYETGGNGGFIQTIYENARSHSNLFKPLLDLAKWEIIQALYDYKGPIVADHAYVAPGRGYLIQSDVKSEPAYADKKSIVFVPLRESAEQLLQLGHPEDKVNEVGFFVPRKIKDKHAKELRKTHLKDGFAHIGFFGTGASPPEHYKLLEESILPELVHGKLFDGTRKGKIKLTVYTFTNAKKGREIINLCQKLGLKVTVNDDDHPDGNWQVRIIWGKNNYDAVLRSIEVARQIDYLVSMMGERTGWLHDMPGSALNPIGVNVPHNTNWLEKKDIIQPVEQTRNLPRYISEQLSSGSPDILGRLNKGEILPVDGAIKAAAIIFQG